jgi:hypothetical protein
MPIAWLPCVAGCVSGSLASDTDRHPDGYRLSDRSDQMVHVGETVEFDFVLQDAFRRLVPASVFADYCAVFIGPERVEVEPDLAGHCRFTYRFDEVQAGDTVFVRATAFRQRGRRDFMKVRGRWLGNESPLDTPDQAVGHDTITLTVYERPIELRIAHPPDVLDPDSGVLRIRRIDGTATVYPDRPHRPGFTMTGPQPDGYVYIRYRPGGDELSSIGTTEVEFEIYDVAGQRHSVSATLDTP